MTPEIINKLFPNPLPSIEEIEAKYPPRQLPEGAKVTRVAPSPTGFMHVGTVYQALIDERIAHQSGGLFYVRIEDTDQKRKVPGAVELISKALYRYHLIPDEGIDENGNDVGPYAPYTQSERKEIYQVYAKYLLEKGLAYPCFCSTEDVDLLRKIQEKSKTRPGYHGSFAKCRTLTDEQILQNLQAGKPWILRFKSSGDYNKTITIKDLSKGVLVMPENDLDIVILKSDGLPTYHFAHAVDDHLMKTTHVVRGDDWVSSTPLHIQLFKALGWEPPKYAQLANLLKLDNGNKRKLSKRHDPEANIAFFWEKGYPEDALLEYLMNILNANFEDWRKANPDKTLWDFQVNFNKISNTGGALFDYVKLDSIARDVIARMTAQEVYDAVLKWAQEYDTAFAKRLQDNKEYAIAIFDIERTRDKKARKDITVWSTVKEDISYFFTDTFTAHPELLRDFSKTDIQKIAADFLRTYSAEDDNQIWFDKIKEVATHNGFCPDIKTYKANPDAFKGSVADVAKILRVLITGRTQSPDLHSVMQVMGLSEITRRLGDIK